MLLRRLLRLTQEFGAPGDYAAASGHGIDK
jgi:hypothetical protein